MIGMEQAKSKLQWCTVSQKLATWNLLAVSEQAGG
jgi:hypothetical protein